MLLRFYSGTGFNSAFQKELNLEFENPPPLLLVSLLTPQLTLDLFTQTACPEPALSHCLSDRHGSRDKMW